MRMAISYQYVIRRVFILDTYSIPPLAVSHSTLMQKFETVMSKLAVLGQNTNDLIDCSEVIPQPKGSPSAAHFPAGKSIQDVDASCRQTPFPRLPTAPGPKTSLQPVYVLYAL